LTAERRSFKSQTMKTNPLICDPELGICELPQSSPADSVKIAPSGKQLKIIYFTDPICSTCWGIEAQVRKLKLEYGAVFEIQYYMGGLLPDWSYNSGGISKPSDVAHHWDEVSAHYQMPIDGDIWLEDPLHSSYPPSVAFKAAQLQGGDKAIAFLRRIREMVFLEKKNITKWEHLSAAALQVGMDADCLKKDLTTKAEQLFQADLQLAKRYGVRGFPTIFIEDGVNRQEKVYGFKVYSAYENAIQQMLPDAQKASYDQSWEALFSYFQTMTVREFSELSGLTFLESHELLNKLATEGKLSKFDTKNGALWKRVLAGESF